MSESLFELRCTPLLERHCQRKVFCSHCCIVVTGQLEVYAKFAFAMR